MADNNSVLNSELAVEILKAIASSTGGEYPTKLAEELERSQPSISRLLSDLHGLNFIEKAERKQKQYYRVNYSGMADYWYWKIREKLKDEGEEADLEELEQNSQRIKEVASTFFRECLSTHQISDMTVTKFIFDGFAYSIGYNMLENDNLLEKNEFLRPVLVGLRLYTEEKEFCPEICEAMEKSIEKTLK